MLKAIFNVVATVAYLSLILFVVGVVAGVLYYALGYGFSAPGYIMHWVGVQ